MMSQIDVELVHEFKGETVVLASLDADGLDLLTIAISSAIQNAKTTHSELEHNETLHIFQIEEGQSKIIITDRKVVWSLSNQAFSETLEKLRAMKELGQACHHFVEIFSPAETLVLSLNEY